MKSQRYDGLAETQEGETTVIRIGAVCKGTAGLSVLDVSLHHQPIAETMTAAIEALPGLNTIVALIASAYSPYALAIDTVLVIVTLLYLICRVLNYFDAPIVPTERI